MKGKKRTGGNALRHVPPAAIASEAELRCRGPDRLRALDGQLRLFAAGGVLVDHALGGGLVDRAHGMDVRLFGRVLVAGLQRLVIAADGGLERGLDHAVAQVLLLSHLDPLHGGLDVCQIIHPLCARCKF